MEQNLQKAPRAFSFKRSEFSDINNALDLTKQVIRPSDHTFFAMRSNFK